MVFISAFIIFEAGSLVCGIAQSSLMFIIGRAISGAGGAGILNGGFTIIAAAAPLEDRPSMQAVVIINFFIRRFTDPYFLSRAYWDHARHCINRSCDRPLNRWSFNTAC